MQPCPRQTHEATMEVQRQHQSHWRDDDGTCSYCGSISPEQLFAAIAAGAELGPTDKNYKVYVRLGERAQSHIATLREGAQAARVEYAKECRDALAVLERMPVHPKFYFQHLSDDEQQRFVDLLNAKQLNIGYPGHFYRLPFFAVPKT